LRFNWDAVKSERNRQERGFGFEFAALIFEGVTLEWPDDRRDYGEVRVRAIGQADDLVLHVVFTDRGDCAGLSRPGRQTGRNGADGTRVSDA
jgi:uncharacterized DUF497 family protein